MARRCLARRRLTTTAPCSRPTARSGELAFSVGNNVYIDGGDQRATIDDTSVKSLYYTSAGILVRQGNNPDSDGGGPQRFSLVAPDGTVKPISVVTEETVHSTDPTQPYLAYAETTSGSTDVVVWNLENDSEEARDPAARRPRLGRLARSAGLAVRRPRVCRHGRHRAGRELAHR